MVRALVLLASVLAARGLRPPRPPRSPRGFYGAADGGDPSRLRSSLPLAASFALGAGSSALASRRGGGGGGAGGGAGAAADLGDFTGRWRLDRSVNFDAYLKSLNVSATHRRFACRAGVDHDIDHADRDAMKLCVINRLGKKCETIKVGETIASTDTYGNPNTKTTSWDKDGVTMRTTIDSTVGRVLDSRKLEDADTMVMALTSPSKVTAYRYFRRVEGGAAPAVAVSKRQAAGLGAGAAAVAVGLAAGAGRVGFVFGARSAREDARARG